LVAGSGRFQTEAKPFAGECLRLRQEDEGEMQREYKD